jgi:murein L,D-transpeptidase YcbB/YkuD
LLSLVPTLATPAATGDVARQLEQRLEATASAGSVAVEGVTLPDEPLVDRFYAHRAYAPAWTDAGRASALVALLAQSPEHGLDPADFFLETLRAMQPDPADAAGIADRDLLLTTALVRYGYQRRFGKVNPEKLSPDWNFGRGFASDADPATVLAEAVASPSLAAFIDEKVPPGPLYRQLRLALERYRGIAAQGGWPTLPAGATLRAGERDPRVPALRGRLRIEGDLAADASPPADPLALDGPLVAALRSFQARHSLAADGTAGPRTLEAVNVPVEDRVDEIRMSLERVRWLSGGAPSTYVVVNVAGFRVAMVRDNRLLWTSRVVVGRAARQTPIFRDTMTYVELNPTWTVPPTILREDVLPKLKRDPGYLARENISVIDRSGRIVDPRTVNWNAYSRTVPYTLRQGPGPENSLGRVKLMFPNEHSVYLHDTPSKALFDKPERTFSSGCIRVEDPLALAELVLNDPAWSKASLEAAIATGKTRRIGLKQPVPVLLVYLTAMADPDGTPHFFRDVYDRDPALLRALNSPMTIDLPVKKVATAAAGMRGPSL